MVACFTYTEFLPTVVDHTHVTLKFTYGRIFAWQFSDIFCVQLWPNDYQAFFVNQGCFSPLYLGRNFILADYFWRRSHSSFALSRPL